MKVALFVEGAFEPMEKWQKEPLERTWKEHIAGLAGRGAWSHVFPISKRDLEHLDPDQPRASGAGEALDQVIARRLRNTRQGFDAVVVAWDLVPPLHAVGPPPCRARETRWLMERLAASAELAEFGSKWTDGAKRWLERHPEGVAAVASGGPLRAGEVRPLCMEPEFESLLLCENEIRAVLGATGMPKKGAAGWPKDWSATGTGGGKKVLKAAIGAAKKAGATVKPPVKGEIDNDAPNAWAEWFLREMIARETGRAWLEAHPIVRRVAELLA